MPQKPDPNALRWQDKYAEAKWQERLTKLSPGMEKDFQSWAKQNGVPVTPDYDMRGFYKALKAGDPRAVTDVNSVDQKLHFTDFWKTPLHESFSGESIYSNPNVPGPKWNSHNQLLDAVGHVLYDEYANKRK